MSIEIKGTLSLYDNGEIWFGYEGSHQCLHGRQDTQRETLLDAILRIMDHHASNNVSTARRTPDVAGK